MRTRRDNLIKREEYESNRAGPPRTRPVTLRDLAETRVIVPPEVHETGMSVIITVANDGRLQPGLIESSKLPVTRPITDLNRLGRARAIVSSLEATESKTSLISSVKETLITNLVIHKTDPSKIQLRVGVQTEILRCKVLQEIFNENLRFFESNEMNRNALHFDVTLNWFQRSLEAISYYILESLLKAGSKKLNDFTSEYLVPRWFFSRFSQKVPELKLLIIDDILFPKRISKMITFLEEEVKNEAFCKNACSFSNTFHHLRNIGSLFGWRHDLSPLYPLPPNLSRLENLSDLPVIDSTQAPSTILSVAVVHMFFCAIPPKAIEVDNFHAHEESLLFSSDQSQLKLRFERVLKLDATFAEIKSTLDLLKIHIKDYTQPIKGCNFIGYDEDDKSLHLKFIVVPMKTGSRFAYDESLGTLMKVQYKEHVLSLGKIFGFCPTLELAKVFHLSNRELDGIQFIMLDQPAEVGKFARTLDLFRPPSKEDFIDSSLKEKLIDRLKAIKPVPPKEQNFGKPYSPLTREGQLMIMGLKKHGHNEVFILNVEAYLRSFFIDAFQKQAVRIMTASLQSYEILVSDPVGEQGSEIDVNDPDIPDFS